MNGLPTLKKLLCPKITKFKSSINVERNFFIERTVRINFWYPAVDIINYWKVVVILALKKLKGKSENTGLNQKISTRVACYLSIETCV